MSSSSPPPRAAESHDDGTNIFEISGVVKWFNQKRQFGFVLPDNGMSDALLHLECLRTSGHETVNDGARIVCEVKRLGTGLRVQRVISVDSSNTSPRIRRRQEIPAQDVQSIGPVRAQVASFNRMRVAGGLEFLQHFHRRQWPPRRPRRTAGVE